MGLTPQQIEAFETDGFLVGIDAADAEQVRRTQDAFRAFENRVGHEKVQTGLGNLHFEEPFAWELVTNPKVLDCVGSLGGPDILLMRTRTFCKYGPSNDFVAWHQDVIYWGLEPPLRYQCVDRHRRLRRRERLCPVHPGISSVGHPRTR